MHSFRKNIILIALLAALCICSAQAAGIGLPETATVTQGESLPLISNFGTDVVFSCTDTAIVLVDQSGTITGVSPGSATVTAQRGEDSESCLVTVEAAPKIAAESSTVYTGYPVPLRVVRGENAETGSVRWKSSSSTVARISDDGTLTPVKAGKVTITAALTDGTTVSRQFTVKNPSVSLSGTSLTLYAGTEKNLTPRLYPAQAEEDLVWYSSSGSVASVQDGVITAKKAGICTITAKLPNGSKASCTLTVKAQSLKLNRSRATVYEGKTVSLYATVLPSGSNDHITYYSSNKKVATVDQSGVITGVAPGTATITAKLDSGIKVTCIVTVKKSTVSLNRGKVSLYEGKTVTLTAAIAPEGGLYDEVVFFSGNKNVATVDQEGVITGVAPGTCTITAKLPNNSRATCTVTVMGSTVSLSSKKLSLYEGKTATLTASITPEDGLYEDVVFFSSNKNVATVDQEGVITGIAPGTCTITAKLPNNSRATCSVTVKKSSVSLNRSKASIYEGKTTTLTAVITPEGGLYEDVVFFSSNKNVATVDQEGVVTGIAPGTAVITAKLPNDSRATCTVTVKKSSVSLDRSKASIYEGRTTALTASITPEDGLYTEVTFYSSNKKVATVDQEGMVTGVAPGTAVITAKLPNGSKATCTVTVKKSTVSLNRSKASIYEGKTAALTATIAPEGGLYEEATFYSSNKKVATVDQEGVITGIAPGTCTITAKLPNGSKATCTVTVKKSTVSLSTGRFSLYQGLTLDLSGYVNITGGKYTAASYSSNNKKVAVVNSQGIVTGKSAGTATITVKLPNGSQTSCTVSVKKDSIRFDDAQCAAYLGGQTQLKVILPTGSPLAEYVSYVSSDPEVISVDAQGQVRGLRQGTAVITASLPSGTCDSIALTVKLPEVRLENSRLVLYMDSNVTLNAREYPATGASLQFAMESDTPSIVRVSDSGELTPVSLGSAVITVTHPNGNTASCTVEVREFEVYSVSLSAPSATVYEGDILQITSRVLHEQAQDKTLTWSSSNQKVATVDASGQVTAVGKGSCTITATAANGVSGSCKISVNGTTYRALALTEFGMAGMNRYMPPAQNATRTISSVLKKWDYDVTAVYTPLSKSSFLSEIITMGSKADKNDLTLIYITTHGVLHNDRFYLTVPGWYENVGDMRYAISSAELVSAISGIDGHVVLCINACNSGAFLQEMTGTLSGMDVTVICSSPGGVDSGWYNGASKMDFMTWGICRTLGHNMPDGAQVPLNADKDNDGALTAREFTNYARYYISKVAADYFSSPLFVGDDEPQVPQILVTDPDQVLFKP